MAKKEVLKKLIEDNLLTGEDLQALCSTEEVTIEEVIEEADQSQLQKTFSEILSLIEIRNQYSNSVNLIGFAASQKDEVIPFINSQILNLLKTTYG